MKYLIIGLIAMCCFASCQGQVSQEEESMSMNIEQFQNYWYQGKAEISTYELSQARYGELRKGDAILVFVTEDFLVDKQVKKESATKEASKSVLKLNFIRKFLTGIYDYSMMTSTFSPINQMGFGHPIKSTTTSQEWCGHSFLQLNQLKENSYKATSFSYFEAEGDETKLLENALLEDGIWAQIRMNPEVIKGGEMEMIPSAHYLRFAHKELKAYEAIVSKVDYLKEDLPGDQLEAISINYPTLKREITIVYEKEFPHAIAGWKESRDSFGKPLQTTAKRKVVRKSAYWGEHGVKDEQLREKIQLD